MPDRPNRLSQGRDQRPKRMLRLGGYLIITDTEETEVNYFRGFISSIPSKYGDDLQIKIFPGRDLKTIIEFARIERDKDIRFRDIWIVFDRDKVKNFDTLIEDAYRSNMNIGWSNPCFEIWMSAYFGKMKTICTSVQCCSEFKRLLIRNTNKKSYNKSDKDIYDSLNKHGNEQIAIEIAQKRHVALSKEYRKPSDMIACTTVYLLIDEIRRKTKE